MSRTLLFRVNPYAGECLQGFLLRLAEANRLPSVTWIAHLPDELKLLRELIGVSLHGLLPSWMQKAYRSAPVSRCVSDARLLRLRARCCPACFAKARFWRLEWEHIYYVACHVHGCMLVSSCPDCGARLTWNRTTLAACKCGSSIENWPGGAQVSEQERRLCTQLAACLALEAGQQFNGSLIILDERMQKVTEGDLSNLIFVFGTNFRQFGDSGYPGFRGMGSFNDRPDFVRVTANVLSTWPEQFRTFLREYGGLGKTGMLGVEPSGRYCLFAKALRAKFRTPGLDFIFEEYRTYLTQNWNGVFTRRNTWMNAEDFDKQRYLSGAAAYQQFGFPRRRTMELIERNLLRGYIKRTPHGREFVIIERSSLAYAQELLGDSITLKRAAVLLGLPRERVCELVSAGYITEFDSKVADLKHNTRASRGRVFSRKELASFIRRLNTGRREPSEEEGLLGFSVLLKIHLATQKEFAALVGAILSTQLSTVSMRSGRCGFADIAVGRDQFQLWRRSMRLNVDGAQFTVNEAAKRLGVKQEVGYHLVAHGLLRSAPGKMGKRQCRVVAGEDIDQFMSEYMSGVELAQSRKTSPKAAVASILAEGVRPVAGPGVDACRQYFFFRADIVRPGPKE